MSLKINGWIILGGIVLFVIAGLIARWDASVVSNELFFGSDLKTCIDPKPVEYSKLGAYAPIGSSLFLRGVVIEVPLENTDRITIRRSCTLSTLDSPKDTTEPQISFEGAKALSDGINIGDEIYVQLALDGKILKGLAVRQIKPSRIWAPILITIIVMLSLILVLTGLFKSGFKQLFIGKDGRMSNSQTQIAIWFFMVISTLLTTLILRVMYTHFRYASGIEIQENLLLLSGLSAIVFIGARVAKEVQVGRTPNLSIPDATNPQLSQLWTSDDGKFDLTDFQMIVVTVVAAFTYFLSFLAYLEVIPYISRTALPDVNGTVLALFGLGQGAYLTRKITDAVIIQNPLIPNFSFQSGSAIQAQAIFSNLNGLSVPIGFTVTPALPAGLTMDNTTSLVTGSPTTITPATQFTVRASDVNSITRTQNISITIT